MPRIHGNKIPALHFLDAQQVTRNTILENLPADQWQQRRLTRKPDRFPYTLFRCHRSQFFPVSFFRTESSKESECGHFLGGWKRRVS